MTGLLFFYPFSIIHTQKSRRSLYGIYQSGGYGPSDARCCPRCRSGCVGRGQPHGGVALDEPKRLARLNKEKDISLLAKYGLTEADAWRLCEKYDMLSPCYQHSKRNGCWFCPNASNSELSHMVNRHPELFDRLIEWERTDNLYHRRLTRTETPSEVKARLMSKPQPEFSISKQ